MRNLFDQYNHPENRLTHALVSALHQDHKLLKQFVRWAAPTACVQEPFSIIEQSLPGEEETEEETPERRGLPDAWIYNDNEESASALLIESKIMCALSGDQIRRHLRTAKKRGFVKCALLVICLETDNKKIPQGVFKKTWSEVYEWAALHSRKSEWARLFAEYCEIAEEKMVQKEYLTDGKLTKFSGVDFSDDQPYTYLKAKRLLSLLVSELKSDRSFVRKMGIDPKLEGRPAITGSGGRSVWDILRPANSKGPFTSYPHFTLAIGAETASALVTLPNGVKRSIRKKIMGGGFENFCKIILKVAKNMKNVFRVDHNVKPYIKVIQRHYKSQRSAAVEDASLKYDLRTVFKLPNKHGVKQQPEYLQASYDILQKRRSNIQFEVGVEIPYQRSAAIHTVKAIKLYKEAFLALNPFVKTALKK